MSSTERKPLSVLDFSKRHKHIVFLYCFSRQLMLICLESAVQDTNKLSFDAIAQFSNVYYPEQQS